MRISQNGNLFVVFWRFLQMRAPNVLDRPTHDRRDRLERLVREVIAGNDLARPERIDSNLQEAGLTSLDTVKLVLSIEREFGIVIGPDDFDAENFETLDALVSLVGRLSV